MEKITLETFKKHKEMYFKAVDKRIENLGRGIDREQDVKKIEAIEKIGKKMMCALGIANSDGLVLCDECCDLFRLKYDRTRAGRNTFHACFVHERLGLSPYDFHLQTKDNLV